MKKVYMRPQTETLPLVPVDVLLADSFDSVDPEGFDNEYNEW